jgi:periplasmic protein TonB
MARSLLSPFGTLLAEMREVQMLSRPAAAEGRAATAAARPALEPDLRIETRVVSGGRRSASEKAPWLWMASLLLHGAFIAGLVVIPLMLSEVLPAPAHGTRAYFVGPASLVAPPPPPPPPAASARASAPKPKAPAPVPAAVTTLTAPADIPEPAATEAADPGVAADSSAGGETGGVEGGVPGGIVGGVVGGVPAPPAPVMPVRVGGEIREPKKLRHVSPVYPDVAVAARVRGSVILECMVSPQGRVTDVMLVRGVPLLNESAIAAVRQWLYTPTLKDGVPVPVILTVTVRFDL